MINNYRTTWTDSVLARAVHVLSRQDRRKVLAVIMIQIALGILDLLGVALIGVLGALAVNGIQSRPAGDRVTQILDFFGIAGAQFQTQAAVLGGVASLVLIFRTACSVFFMRRILFFLSRRGAQISANLISKLLSQSILAIHVRSSQEILYAVTTGVSVITLGILGTIVSLISDLALLSIMAFGLFVVDPTIAISTFVVFSLIGLVMYWTTQRRAHILGEESAQFNVQSNEKIMEVLYSYREAVVKNRRNYYSREIGKVRLKLANTAAETAFLPNISKYVIETALVLSALGISAIQFLLQDAAHAVATLSVFLAAGTRIAPAVLRVQQSALGVRSSLGAAGPTLNLIDSMKAVKDLEEVTDNVEIEHFGFIPDITIENMSFSYPKKDSEAVRNLNLRVEAGKFVAIVGSSGAGKTTLVDLLLGVLKPDSGKILISGHDPQSTISKWSGAISYVPQDVMISNGTIRENVGLGFPTNVVTDDLVNSALKIAALDEYVKELVENLDTPVGERGVKMSGGQRQRLGIARAMFTKPTLLVLDEATSSLDGETEASVADAIQNLKGKVTVVMIAHRLSTVKNADLVVYMHNGELIAQGTFNEVRDKVPDFDRQAKLMGL
jgi:ABC-type multidrug transport system fused ATPase/permease subunit